MAQKSIIIINAGVGGLFTGIYRQMNGYQTRIYEADSIPSGVSSGREVIWRQCRNDKK
jgi:phytoene dehydrogenase-like protein